MNQEQNNLNPNNFNTQGNNGIPNNQPLNNQSFNNTSLNQQPVNVNNNIQPNNQVNTGLQTNINPQQVNSQFQPTQKYQQPQPTPSYQQQVNVQQPTNVNNNVNNKSQKKNKLGLIIGIVAALILILVVIILILSNSNKNNINNNSTNTNTNTDTNISDNSSQNKEDNQTEYDPEFYKSWGKTDYYRAVNANGDGKLYYINFPDYKSFGKGNGRISEQNDGTLSIISGQRDGCPLINDISELFPAYNEHLEYTLHHLHGILSKNYNFTFSENKPITIGDYDMHMFKGEVTFEDDGEPRKYQFIAYATQLKSNGAYAYWLVMDDSEEQNMGKEIAEHAYNMAKTFREEE